MDPNRKLDNPNDSALQDPYEFKSIIGKLFYLTHSRPHIVFSVCRLSQHLAKPTQAHLIVAYIIIGYLKNEPGLGLHFKHHSTFKLTGFTNSYWDVCPITRRSTTVFCFFLWDKLTCWKTKKQLVMSRSSSEAECRALANTSCEAQWLLYLL